MRDKELTPEVLRQIPRLLKTIRKMIEELG